MNIETRTLVRAALDASEYTRGAQQVTRSNEAIAASGEAVAAATDRTQAKLRENDTAIGRLQRSLDATYRSQQQFERAQNIINAAMERGAISAQRASQLLALAQQRYLGSAQAATSFAAANDNAGRSSGRFAQAMGQAGFQIQDFATQVSMGQNALTAFGVQFAQFAGIFGVGGAIAGAVVTIGVLAARLLGMGDAAEEAKKAQETLAAATAATNRVMETQSEAAARQEREQRSAAVQALAAARATIAQAQAIRALRLAELESTEQQIRLAREVGGDDTGLSEVARRRLNEAERLRGELADAAAEFQRIDEQIRTVTTAPTGAARDRAAREEEERRREEERDRRRGEREIDAEQRASDRISQIVQNSVQQSTERRAREEERAREQRQREEERELEQRQQANQRSTDAIVRYGAEAFADMFESNGRGWRGMLDTFGRTFRSLIARLAAEAILRPIIAPIVGGLGLGLGGLGGAGGAGGGLFGGLNLGGLSSIGSLIPGGGVGGLMSTPLWGGAVQGPALPGMAASGAPTLGTALGAVGAGFAAGSFVGGMVAQTPAQNTNAMIGAGAGSAAGAGAAMMIGGAAGGPVGLLIGALLGGILGGAGGGLIGPSRQHPGFNIQIEADGGFGISDAREKGRGDQLEAAYLQTEAELSQANALLSALGVRASGGSALGEDPRNPRVPRSFAQTIGDFRFSAANSNLNRALSVRGSLSSLQELQDIAGFVSLYESIIDIREPVDAFQQQLDAINAQFDQVTARARELGLAEEGLSAARARAIQQAEQARRDQVAGTLTGGVSNLSDFIRGLRTANDNPLNPQSRLAAARADFAALVNSPGAASLDRLRGSAEAFLTASRDVYGTGANFASDFQATLAGVEQFAAAGADVLTAQAMADINRSGTEVLQAELAALRGEVAALRTDVRQNAANPLAARAA